MAESGSRFDPRFDPAFQPNGGGDGPLVVDDPEPLFEHPVPVVKNAPADVAPPRPHGRFNPWLALLWVIGLALTAAGIWAEWGVQKTVVILTRPPTVEEYYVIPAVLSAFSPWLTVVGLAALVSAVYLHAAHWQRQRAS